LTRSISSERSEGPIAADQCLFASCARTSWQAVQAVDCYLDERDKANAGNVRLRGELALCSDQPKRLSFREDALSRPRKVSDVVEWGAREKGNLRGSNRQRQDCSKERAGTVAADAPRLVIRAIDSDMQKRVVDSEVLPRSPETNVGSSKPGVRRAKDCGIRARAELGRMRRPRWKSR